MAGQGMGAVGRGSPTTMYVYVYATVDQVELAGWFGRAISATASAASENFLLLDHLNRDVSVFNAPLSERVREMLTAMRNAADNAMYDATLKDRIIRVAEEMGLRVIEPSSTLNRFSSLSIDSYDSPSPSPVFRQQ